MKRFTTLALLVLALAAVPAALADSVTPPPPTTPAPAAQQQAPSGVASPARIRLRVEILRLRARVVALRFRLHCGPDGTASQERCTAFAQTVLDRLTTLDGKVQAKIADLKSCTPDSTDAKCKNADRKIAVLTRVDEHLQKAIAKIQGRLGGAGSNGSSDSALDQAAGQLGRLAGSNG